MSLASRRNRRDYSNPDDAKSSIVGLSGWLFADLLLALAVVFLVASDRPSQSLAENPEDKFDIDVEFVESELADAKAVTQIERIDDELISKMGENYICYIDGWRQFVNKKHIKNIDRRHEYKEESWNKMMSHLQLKLSK